MSPRHLHSGLPEVKVEKPPVPMADSYNDNNRVNIMRVLLFLLPIVIAVFSYSNMSFAATLTTSNYIVEVIQNCEEGVASCNDVTYIGTSKRSGDSIELTGQAWHATCADGVTPCRFMGYIFKNGDITYLVEQIGVLRVMKNDTVLVEERGEWTY